jgi:hypothetical protein
MAIELNNVSSINVDHLFILEFLFGALSQATMRMALRDSGGCGKYKRAFYQLPTVAVG